MPVTVQQINSSKDGIIEIHVARGEHFVLSNETLVILDGIDGRQVAVFAAGSWLSAQIED